ncbi:fatty acyl-AMP ligase [Rugamonas sp. CCM 8940]|uniref:fatty acyl-AMP ligase n=1 Tax=Rugamonas sp. CCM 8940 TaxID=2765359 RepID=UPI0018F30EF5|nr:fatty acyl-AMP ligase [Rugamonas sp. CCM 8940]MBJ7312357.1 fatty acyl-AMP ligase [Rugamonas sp. CCM 8940]
MNLCDILRQRATAAPDATAYRFFQGADFNCDSLSYGQLWRQAAALALRFQQAHAAHTRLLIVCKSQKNFTVAFFASLLAGMIAVPTALPRRQAFAARLQLLAHDAQVGAVVFDADEMQSCALEVDGLPIGRYDVRDRLDDSAAATAEAAARFVAPALNGASVAFLQYTSGSTGDPKGVVVSHDNLMHNSALIQEAMQITSASSVLTALPMFHDMGLVGGLLQPMYAGCIGHWMTPAEFVQYPERWLQLMSRFRITTSGGPNFMYSLAARSIEAGQIEGVDLSAWRTAFCGAEPIRAATFAHFSERFAAHGFSARAFYPCYGMAESTLFITGKKPDVLPSVCTALGSDVVSCGVSFGDTTVKIVDPDSATALPELAVGEIWVSGRSVAQGYWRRAELTGERFQAALAGQEQGAYLRTGDLGYLKDGELHVTGRLKDLIIAYGKKYAPQDIEEEAERSHAALRESGGAAFSVSGKDGEALVLVCELEREWLRRQPEWSQICAAVRKAVREAHGLVLDDIVFIKPGALPRTSSGKVMRSQCRSDYLSGSLARLAQAA